MFIDPDLYIMILFQLWKVYSVHAYTVKPPFRVSLGELGKILNGGNLLLRLLTWNH
jgi:hypothetical protein